MNFIPYARQDIDESDIGAVVEVLRSEMLTQGPVIGRFEESLATYCGVDHAVAVSSATAALHLGALALGLGPGDWLWTSPITFVASANCALYCGARVDFVDIEPSTGNLDMEVLGLKLETAEKLGKLPKVVVPVHLGGLSCDMKTLRSLADRFGFAIMEDASHAVGACYGGAPVGNCTYSDLTVFSFHPVKILTTGEGGMVMTRSAQLAARVALLRSHGITRDPELLENSGEGPWYYEQQELGYHYRMTDLEAALGLNQLKRLDAFVARRNEIASLYDTLLEGLPLHRPGRTADAHSSWHLYIVRLEPAENHPAHRVVFQGLRAAGIGVNLHYIPVYRQPYYQRMGFSPASYPQAEAYYATAISLPIHYRLTNGEVERVVRSLKSILAG